jgi:uncharacterized protein with HEPN domain
MKKDDLPYLQHIKLSLERIGEYASAGREVFSKDSKTQDAILRNLQTMAESTQKLSTSLKGKYPEVPWVKLSGFRNILVHNYLGLNLDRIWEVVEKNIPEFKVQFARIFRDHGV